MTQQAVGEISIERIVESGMQGDRSAEPLSGDYLS